MVWLACLAAAAADKPAEMACFVVERIEALQFFRLLIARSLAGAVEGLDAEGAAYAQARELLEDRYGYSMASSEGLCAGLRQGVFPRGEISCWDSITHCFHGKRRIRIQMFAP